MCIISNAQCTYQSGVLNWSQNIYETIQVKYFRNLFSPLFSGHHLVKMMGHISSAVYKVCVCVRLYSNVYTDLTLRESQNKDTSVV